MIFIRNNHNVILNLLRYAAEMEWLIGSTYGIRAWKGKQTIAMTQSLPATPRVNATVLYIMYKYIVYLMYISRCFFVFEREDVTLVP